MPRKPRRTQARTRGTLRVLLAAVLLAAAAPVGADHDGDPTPDTAEEAVCGPGLASELVNQLPSEAASCANRSDVQSGIWDGQVEHCSASVCVRILPTERLGSLTHPGAGGQLTVRVELGHLVADVAGEESRQLIPLGQVNGQPPRGVFDHSVGPVETTYETEDEICVRNSCEFSLGADPDDAKLGELWRARLQVSVAGLQVTDQPFLTVALTE